LKNAHSNVKFTNHQYDTQQLFSYLQYKTAYHAMFAFNFLTKLNKKSP